VLTRYTQFTDIIELSTEARMKAVNILTSLYLHKKRRASSRVEEQSFRVPEGASRVVEQAQSPPQQSPQPIAVPDRSQDIVERLRQRETAHERRKPSNEMRHRSEQVLEPKKEQRRSSWKRKLSGLTQSYVDEVLNAPVSTQIEQPPTPAHP
jgi:hypothetical protein